MKNKEEATEFFKELASYATTELLRGTKREKIIKDLIHNYKEKAVSEEQAILVMKMAQEVAKSIIDKEKHSPEVRQMIRRRSFVLMFFGFIGLIIGITVAVVAYKWSSYVIAFGAIILGLLCFFFGLLLRRKAL